jgi:hypothetical protein
MTQRPPIDLATHGGSTTVLIGGSASEPERLLLISRPVNGVAYIREWTSADWAATPDERESPVESLYEDVELAARAGRTLNLDLATLRHFLGIR